MRMTHIAANVDRDLENFIKWKSKTNHCHSLDRRPNTNTHNRLHNRFWILYASETQESGHKVRTEWTSDFVFVVVCCADVYFDFDGLLMNSANAKRWHQINCKLIKFENSILGCSRSHTHTPSENECTMDKHTIGHQKNQIEVIRSKLKLQQKWATGKYAAKPRRIYLSTEFHWKNIKIKWNKAGMSQWSTRPWPSGISPFLLMFVDCVNSKQQQKIRARFRSEFI